MNIATPISRPMPPKTTLPKTENACSGFYSIFEHAPFVAARCNQQGLIIEINPVLKKCLNAELANRSFLRLDDLVSSSSRYPAQSILRDVLAGTAASARIPADREATSQQISSWSVWRVPVDAGELPEVLLTADLRSETADDDKTLLQAQRWEAVGRLAGGVVHDFNNLLTGVMLYTDLLLSSIDPRDRRRRYADEIRSAIIQASGLVRQLLVFARPQKPQIRSLCLNQVAEDMKDLLTRLIGENISLEFRLDPDLGPLTIDHSQAQQIILNLILNARDAMPNGGRIVVETSNCKFQGVLGATLPQPSVPAFPCILFAVSDNGCGMDESTRRHLFQPFFTTKSAGTGTGLGLTTVHSIVTTHSGLIHVDSEPERGTRIMILFPRASQITNAVFISSPASSSQPSPQPLQFIPKESHL
jgi:signal transduction histidine kinase